MRKHIPNAITSLNLFSGAVGIVAALSGFWFWAFWMLILSAVFDFFDGLSARWLQVSSPMGKELDSLADIISFGMLPGAMMFELLRNSYNLPQLRLFGVLAIPFVGLLLPVFSALRLAKFNIDERQSEHFIGLPTPAAALFVGGLSLTLHYLCHCNALHHFLGSYMSLIIITLLLSWALVAELPLLSLKIKNLSLRDNLWAYLLVGGVLLIAGVFIFMPYVIPWAGILYYLALSIIHNSLSKNDKDKS